MQYDVVFDVRQAGYGEWLFVLPGLLFVVVGVGLVYHRERVRERMPGSVGAAFPYLFLGFATVWTMMAFAATYLHQSTLRDALEEGRAHLVEGPVTQFVPMPYEGHRFETFVVGGMKFEYSDYVLTGGFNNTKSHGGPIREGLKVRIWHVKGRIARLEIARAE